MIKEVCGALLQQPVDIIAHQTNCRGVMGAGIAKQIKDYMLSKRQYKQYVDMCRIQGSALLGQVQMMPLPNGQLIANCFGEDVPTGKGLDTNYEALKASLTKVCSYAKEHQLSVGIPGLMGCGLAGGDWNIVREMIYEIFSEDTEVIISYFSEADYHKYNN